MCLESPACDQGRGGGTETAVPASAEADTVTAAEEVLSSRFGATIALAEPEDLGGSGGASVIRARVASSPFTLPKSLVLKRYPAPPSGVVDDGFAREAVSYQLFTALAEDDRMCPQLIAHGATQRVLVLEDLGKAETLADKLLAHDPRAAEHGLLSWSRSLGRLHATTAGREADFDALMRRQESPCGPQDLVAAAERANSGMPALLESVTGRAPRQGADVVSARTGWLLDGSRHRAFSPSDICPDNNLITDSGVRFLDFEGGCVREALLDVGHLLVPFPLCWCAFALPESMTTAMLAAWRAEVVGVWPEMAEDSVLESHLLDARLFWAWLSTWQLLPREGEDDSPIEPTAPSPRRGVTLAAQWRAVAIEADRIGAAGVAELAQVVGEGLTAKFGSSLEVFPAFR